MVKKIVDLTIKEVASVCGKQFDCSDCPFFDEPCLFCDHPFLWVDVCRDLVFDDDGQVEDIL